MKREYLKAILYSNGGERMSDYALLEIIERLMLTGLTREEAMIKLAKVMQDSIESFDMLKSLDIESL